MRSQSSFQILSPLMKVSKTFLGDILQNKLLEEATETVQDFINHFYNSLPALTPPPERRIREPRILKHYLSLDQANITAVLLFFK